jgi:hypothetical protein
MTVDQIWTAIDQGQTVHWQNGGYVVEPVPSNGKPPAKLSERGNQALRCFYTANYFGGYLHPTDLANCYVAN